MNSIVASKLRSNKSIAKGIEYTRKKIEASERLTVLGGPISQD